MRSKEEILGKCSIKYEAFFSQIDPMRFAALEAMEEYAREVHFGYKKWVDDIVTKGGKEMEQLKRISDKQLFEVFLNQQKQS